MKEVLVLLCMLSMCGAQKRKQETPRWDPKGQGKYVFTVRCLSMVINNLASQKYLNQDCVLVFRVNTSLQSFSISFCL